MNHGFGSRSLWNGLSRSWKRLAETRLLRADAIDYRALFENFPVGIFRMDAAKQRFVVANPALARILRFASPGDLCRQLVVEELFVARTHRQQFLRMCGDEALSELEARVRCKDGSRRWVMISVVGTSRDSEQSRVFHDGVLYDVTARKRAQSSLHRLSARLLQLRDEERRRIARELHDNTGQDLAALEMNLVRLQSSVRGRLGEQDESALSESLALVQHCSRKTRSMSYLLYPPLLDELGLEVALQDFIEGFTHGSGVAVRVEVSPDLGRLRPEVETALFRIVQECLVNVQRHSGSPNAELRLVAHRDRIRLEVEDQGRGISRPVLSEEGEGVEDLGVGIRGMRERMHQLGGRLTVESGNWGTKVRATLPTDMARVQEEG
ncbi:MAG TPA: ATP-binding protein [Vicinamibacteria bacterium]|nr:ATP-binding protein [Vicinamibacteria bacterium]